MTEFKEAVEFILYLEGGYGNHPEDNGGETNYGISKAAFPDEDIINITRERAIKLYKEEYWDKVNADQLPPGVDLIVFDMAVNAGYKRSARILQGLIGAKKDGLIGPETIAAVNKHKSKDIIMRFNIVRLLYYTNLGDFQHFGEGWFNRAMKCFLASITKMEGH